MSDGKILSGQQYDTRKNAVLPFTEQMMDYTGDTTKITGVEGQAKTEIIPNDVASAKVRVFNTATIEAALATLYFSWPGKVSFFLPDVLTGITVVWNSNAGNGASSHPASQMGAAYDGSGSASVNPKATAQGSVSLIPDIQPAITRYVSQDIDCMFYTFYSTNPSLVAVLARLTTLAGEPVTSLPVWKPKQHTITGKGGQVSVQASADSSASVSGGTESASHSYDWGNGYSKETGVANRTEVIPATIHGDITILDATLAVGTSVSVDASTIAMVQNGSTVIPAIVNAPAAVTGTVYGEIVPSTLGPTSPAAIPTTGLKLVDISASPDDFGFVFVRAAVVDFSIYA